jgi:hypothetical protein
MEWTPDDGSGLHLGAIGPAPLIANVRRNSTFMKPHTFLTLFALLSIVLAGCVSRRSEVATAFGFKNSVKVEAGPYQLHYAHDGTNDFVLLGEGNWNMFSRWTEIGTDVYLDGRPFINFRRAADGSVTNLSMHVLDKNGKERFTLVDRNVDGQWDMKIDEETGKVYVWKDGGWVQR